MAMCGVLAASSAAAGWGVAARGSRPQARSASRGGGVMCGSGGGGFGKKVRGTGKANGAAERARTAQEKREAEVGQLLTELVGALAKGGEDALGERIRAHADELDETWFMMAAQYTKMAEAEGLEANYAALKTILRAAVAETRARLPPEVRLVQRLLQLNLGSADEAAAVREAIVREMGDEVVDLDLMARLVTTMRADVLAAKDKGYEESAETLAVLEALLAQMQRAADAGRPPST